MTGSCWCGTPADSANAPLELGGHDSWVAAVAALADGRVVTGGGDGIVLVWDPADRAKAPLQLGRHDRAVEAVTALADGRVVSGGEDGRILVWDPALPASAPLELGHHGWAVVTALADGRVVSGGGLDGRVLVWETAAPESAPLDLGHHDCAMTRLAALYERRASGGVDAARVLLRDSTPASALRGVMAVAALADGRVVSGGDDERVLVWNPAAPESAPLELGCSVTALATGSVDPVESALVVAHKGQGFSVWSLPTGYTQDGAPPRAGRET